MSSVDSGVESDSKAMITTKMVALNRFSKDKSFEENMDDFYDIFIGADGSELFACKYDQCHSIEKQESDIMEHLKQHFFAEMPSNGVDISLSAEEPSFSPKEVDSDVECINISDDDNSQTDSKHNQLTNCGNSSVIDNNWEQFVSIGFEDEKQVFHCRFSEDCDFKTNLRMKMKSHINKHLTTKVSPKLEFNESEYWDQCLSDPFNNGKTAPTPIIPVVIGNTPKSETLSKHSSKSSSKSKGSFKGKAHTKRGNTSGVKPHDNSLNDSRRETRSSTQTPNTSGLIDINFNHNNTVLSLKGMASVKKLAKYIQCRVINGFKYFCCNYSHKCEFKSKRSQETANHVHCAHLGFYLECVRPDCDKIFRTPGSWREHQKNHICNFGLYGYQRGVTGVCRNSYLLKFQEKVIVENNQKAYKCIWKGCGFVTRQRTACKRHIHNTHVCPYRKNKVWKKELFKFMELKSHMTDKPITDIESEMSYHCSRPQCKAELANEADLRRHESHFCKYRKVVKSVKSGQNGRTNASKESQKPKAVARLVFSPTSPSTSGTTASRNGSQTSNRNTDNFESKETIVENGHKTERNHSNNVQTNGHNISEDIKEKCEKFIKRELYDGIHYILCSAPNCKYTTKIEDKIYDHINKMHSLLSPQKRNSNSCDTIPQLRKRSHSSMDSNDTIVSKKSLTSTDSHQTSHNRNHRSSQMPTQNSTQNIPQKSSKTRRESQNSNDSEVNNNFKNYFKVKRIESEPFYFCDYPSAECRFYSKTNKELFDHISQTHIVFRCNVGNCKREFKTDSLLEVHKRNHICGFGIAGRKATGVCALENVRQYRREVLVDGMYRYECKVCKYTSEVKSAVLSHAHNRHIHPPPPPPQ